MFKKDKKSNKKNSYPITATYATLLNYKGEKSSHLHALSEYIDNSISSYMKDISKIDGNVMGLEIDIEIDSINDYITILDNAGGMNEEELKNAMQPNYTVGKSDNQINQFGVGLKLATFYLGRKIEIITKRKNSNEYALELEINKENENQEAKIEIEEREEPEYFTNNESHGTFIRVSKIHTSPNRKISKNNIFDNKSLNGFGAIPNGLGWRYCGLLESGMKIKISYIDGIGNSREKEIEPFLPKAYTLSSAKVALESNKNQYFNFEEYKSNILEKIENLYIKNSNKIDIFTGNKNFIETLKNDEPLWFSFFDTIENKKVKIEWGILALKDSKVNGNFSYTDLNGFTLLHKGRAIKHGPNQKDPTRNNMGEVMISTFRLEGEYSGGNAVKRRIFGLIDLTNIESPERNKSEFNWGRFGKSELEKIYAKLWNTFKDILNEMMNEENNKTAVRISSKNSSKNQKNISDSLRNEYSYINDPTVGEDFCKVNIDICGSDMQFTIKHSSLEYDADFIQIKKETNLEIIIYLNVNHYLCRTFLEKTDELSEKIKSELLYPLAISLAICKIQQDSLNGDINFKDWALLDDKLEFDDLLNKVLKKLKENK